ncbi:MAG: hypothetical protein MR910_04490 [Clostridiales bacterium]|nr:hypothetical protein [Clostridiales bacterium]
MKKKIFCMLLACLMTMTLVGPISAFAVEAVDPVGKGQSEDVPVPMADHYITYYRVYNGVPQYRIWNATDGYWVTEWRNMYD